MNIKQGFISVDYGTIFYVNYFTEHGKYKDPLLILHGGPGLTHDYLVPLKELAQDRPVIFYDQGGCGKSVVSKTNIDWSLDFYVQELMFVIGALDLKQFHLLGHSWGATVAASYAMQYSHNVKSLILASPWLGAKQWIHDTLVLAHNISRETHHALVEHEQAGTMDAPEYRKAQDLFYSKHFCSIVWPDALQESMNKMNRAIFKHMWGGMYETIINGTLQHIDLIPQLHTITTPTLITCGASDTARPDTMVLASEKIPNAKLEIFKKSTHFPHLEEEQKYLDVIENFLVR